MLEAVKKLYQDFGVDNLEPELTLMVRDQSSTLPNLEGEVTILLGNFRARNPLDHHPIAANDSWAETLAAGLSAATSEARDIGTPLMLTKEGLLVWDPQGYWTSLTRDNSLAALKLAPDINEVLQRFEENRALKRLEEILVSRLEQTSE